MPVATVRRPPRPQPPARSWWEQKSREALASEATVRATAMSQGRVATSVRPPSYDSILATHPAVVDRRAQKAHARTVDILPTDDAVPMEAEY